jgi:hypothetical protein
VLYVCHQNDARANLSLSIDSCSSSSARIMNTDNLGISGSGIGGPNDPYGHHHLIQQHHLLPSHHAAHPSSLYCSSSNAYTELFSPFSADFVASHDPAANAGAPTDYLAAQNSLDYAMSHHHAHHPSHHPHQLASSSNGERTPSSVGTGITGSDSSPSHSYGTSSGYSSSIDYYNTPVHTAKVSVNNSSANNGGSSSTTVPTMVHRPRVPHPHRIQRAI